jgi:hypothetical protein
MRKIDPDKKTKLIERGIQTHLKDLAENSFDLQNNYTPAEICDMMLEKVDLEKGKSILILYNLELLFALKKKKYKGVVTFFTQSEKKANIASKILPGTIVEYIDKEENPLYFMETKWPEKFDIVVANPPYSNNLHIKFLEKSIEVSKDEVVFVHPASSFIHSNKKYDGVNQLIGEQIKSLTFFNGNPIFNIGLYVPCSVTHLSKSLSCGEFNFADKINSQDVIIQKKDISKISLFGYNKTFNDLKVKMAKKVGETSSLHDLCNITPRGSKNHSLNEQDSFFVEFTRIRGNTNMSNVEDSSIFKDDFYTMLKSEVEVKRGCNPKFNIWAEFETEMEGNNFISYCKTDFSRMCLSLGKTSQSLDCGPLKYIPAVDFTQEWNNEKLYAHFGITEEEQAFIKEVIPPYYD